MTKTYNDIEAVTRLLEEKEKDIELTARIGKELLAHNSKLESNVASLENEVRLCNEKITQLSHELLKKTELIQILTNDVDDSGSEASTPTSSKPAAAHFEILQKRISGLENENAALRVEATRLAVQTEDCEQHEAKLVADLVQQLDMARADLGLIGLEGERSRQKEGELKEQIEHLQARLQASDEKLAKALKENEEYLSMIALSRETQCELASELADLKERYAEVVSLLEELRENVRKTKKKNQPTARAGPLYPSLHTSVPLQNPDSLAAELECSLFSELSLDSGIGASTTNIPSFKKVFETVRCASRASSMSSGEASYMGSPAPRLGGTSVTSSPAPQLGGTSVTASPALGMVRPSTAPTLLIVIRDRMGSGRVASPGTPSSEDLEAALKRLTPAAIDAKRTALGTNFNTDDCPTPDSVMSSGSSNYTPWKLPDKLQIVKPLEGSLTLHHWSELATPSLGGLLEERPGVKIRGGTELEDLGLQMYSLCDIEEDDEVNPGKSFQDTSHIYTYTNSTVMHPDDNTVVTASIRGSQMSISSTSSRVSSVCPTPVTRSRRNSTSTYSTTAGLAALLNERGIRAATASALVSPEYTPTATPCNSPVRSSSPTPEEEDAYSSLGLPGETI
ncbi:hypothetical protein AAG570_010488 [Ranatra chinensis]|uniref:Trafficking kinesin-binding protein milt n=1 Tax=Ranatra chinensis TaxID=642074 RepID=A0ABD0Z8S6_9HEMI